MTTLNLDPEQYAVVTQVGIDKLNGLAAGQTLTITAMVLGDGNGHAVTPSIDGTQLTKEIGRESITERPSDYFGAGIFMSADMIEKYHGQWLREVGLIDSDGELIVWCSMAPTLVSLFTERAISVHLPLSSINQITVSVDISKQYASVKALNQHIESETAHTASAIAFVPGMSGLNGTNAQSALLELADKIKNAGGGATVDLTEQSALIANLNNEIHAQLNGKCTLTTSAGELTTVSDGVGRPLYEPINTATYQLLIETDNGTGYFSQKLTIIDLDSDDVRSNVMFVRNGRGFVDVKALGWSPLIGLPPGDVYVNGYIRTTSDVSIINYS
ncbi:phage tail protein [Shewanella sp. D64]|uniref:phage tail-collar fiber domain-containing protein n=1 Tax=unclassified Shewanella TaxID=196818 RepID=UPI0022BA3C6B|nr:MULTISPECIES: phage tail protein [unclassified Shewanella]MEC4728168.1 phage tail protein [Shewanella sp. D64]MEC4740288.1 phage tail protein [Shewanella sp. E94]WBJ94397.1 phage tail protein [Shewanella sp. MTB7]